MLTVEFLPKKCTKDSCSMIYDLIFFPLIPKKKRILEIAKLLPSSSSFNSIVLPVS